jgi:hypothetical protein
LERAEFTKHLKFSVLFLILLVFGCITQTNSDEGLITDDFKKRSNAWQRPDINPAHWPVNKRPYTRPFSSGGTWDAEVTHACLLSWGVRDGIDWK